MKIEEFCTHFGTGARSITEVLRQWQIDDVDCLLQTLRNQHDQLIGATVIGVDAMHGDGLRDQIPKELKEAFAVLIDEEADTYDEIRSKVLEIIEGGDGDLLPLSNMRVGGWFNYLKGQIGENTFQDQVGTHAHLADLRNQPSWDIWVDEGDGACEYIQVKLRGNASRIVEEMRKVQEDVRNGIVEGWHGETVHHIKFAVPEDIADQVRHLAEQHSGLSSMLHEQTIPVSASKAAEIVKEGFDNVGPGQLEHFFGELLCGAAVAGSIHALANGFLWYKGAKEYSDAIASAAASTAITTGGLGLGMVAETLLDTVVLSGAVGIGSRFLLGRFARSRWSFADYMEESIDRTEAHVIALQQ